MKPLDAAKLKKAAPGAALVLFAGPVFLFLAMDLLLFVALSGGKAMRPEQVGTLASEVVFGLFAGLLAAYGLRMVRRALKDEA
ncbi:MAG: hypothetical protein Q8Q88_17840 [Phenylobacterium sp.]|uniref:hypothetical protein n=1 Tax=Phenylobacterium sp. TaxID=1871053 RepID=UPI002732DBBE|nr:hypothetical protein [Phenylobacterium sp.]MDP3748904.1 hypothetical protein [Phenylobacterium sp.]